jgi:hypothetical protein
MTDTVAVANYRTRLDADLAARLLDAAGIPCVINSGEAAMAGPLSPGTTILVRAADADRATRLLESERKSVP